MCTTCTGKFFFLNNPVSNLALEIEHGKDKTGSYVVTAYRKQALESRDHQLWYYDSPSSTIRSKLNLFCLDINNARELIVNPHQSHNRHQLWLMSGVYITCKQTPTHVLGVKDATRPGSHVVVQEATKSETQKWNIDYIEPQYFHVRNLNNQKVISLKAAAAGTWTLCLSSKKRQLQDKQLWFEDNDGLIRSRVDRLFISRSSDKPRSEIGLSADPAPDGSQWILEGASIANRTSCDEVLDVRSGGLFSAPHVMSASRKHKCMTQMWALDYVDLQHLSVSHPGVGKYFVIRNRLTGLAMCVRDSCYEEDTLVVLNDIVNDVTPSPDYIWYRDEKTNTLRSALHDYCLDTDGGIAVVRAQENGRQHQLWTLEGDVIRSCCNISRDAVIQACSINAEGVTKLKVAMMGNSLAQQWQVRHIPADCFFIRCMKSDYVMQIENDVSICGAHVIIAKKCASLSQSQLWYEDEEGLIRSKLNGYVVDGTDTSVQMNPLEPTNKMQLWRIKGFHIRCDVITGLVLDVRRGQMTHGSAVVTAKQLTDRDSQLWRVEYIGPNGAHCS